MGLALARKTLPLMTVLSEVSVAADNVPDASSVAPAPSRMMVLAVLMRPAMLRIWPSLMPMGPPADRFVMVPIWLDCSSDTAPPMTPPARVATAMVPVVSVMVPGVASRR